jgi:hypothetical protein
MFRLHEVRVPREALRLQDNGNRREVVQVLLAIISTVAGVIGALSAAISVLQQRRQTRPQTVVIIVTNIETLAVEHRTDHLSDRDPELDSAA